ncbi:MAG: ribonuclease HII [Dehalococcoidia bacterium]|nr:ribonuclease HII [Dehalococcoidia bacterium]
MSGRNRAASNLPHLREERALLSSGYLRIAGLDEAGRGALAGPVVAAAVVLPPNPDFPWVPLVKDSKLLREKERRHVFDCMTECGIEMGIGVVEPDVIDAVNILNATRKAMKLALAALASPPEYLLIDAVRLRYMTLPQKAIIKGDRTVLSIACASVVAKVTRDHIMLELDVRYPGYEFARHKGYGTREHMECLRRNGASCIHRMTYSPVRDLVRLI